MNANIRIPYLLAVLLFISFDMQAQQTDYFPTFDMMSMLGMSDERPVGSSSGKTLMLADYYGHEVEELFCHLGEPDLTSGILYYSDYPGYRLDFDAQVDISRLLDMHRDKEVAIKIYRWSSCPISVFCVQDSQLFASYPCGLTRLYSYGWDNLNCPMLPLEKWIACGSGDKGWRILMWRDENNGSQSLRTRKKDIEYFRYTPVHEMPGAAPWDSVSGFMSRFSADSFTSLYFNSLELKYFMLDKSVSCHLAEMAGRTEEDFMEYFGSPDSVIETINGNVPFLSLHETWPFHAMLSEYDGELIFPVKIYVYNRDEYELYAYFMRDDNSFSFPKKDGYISLAESCDIYPIFSSGSWKLAYADISPADAENPPYIEF